MIDPRDTRVNVRTGERIVVVLHGVPGWIRWQCACSIARELSRLLGIDFRFESANFENGRPR